MKLRHLESALSQVDPFDSPKIELEQIPTSALIASRMIFTAANTYEDISGCAVGDFGCGPGILSIGSSLMGSAYNIGFDIDPEALETAWVNIRKLEVNDTVDLVQANLEQLDIRSDFDTIVMNPPFGTRKAGIDTLFLKKALNSSNVVYSLHKTSTREHFIKFAQNNGLNIEVIAELRYDIPKTFKYHKEKSKDVFVDLYRFTHKN